MCLNSPTEGDYGYTWIDTVDITTGGSGSFRISSGVCIFQLLTTRLCRSCPRSCTTLFRFCFEKHVERKVPEYGEFWGKPAHKFSNKGVRHGTEHHVPPDPHHQAEEDSIENHMDGFKFGTEAHSVWYQRIKEVSGVIMGRLHTSSTCASCGVSTKDIRTWTCRVTPRGCLWYYQEITTERCVAVRSRCAGRITRSGFWGGVLRALLNTCAPDLNFVQ